MSGVTTPNQQRAAAAVTAAGIDPNAIAPAGSSGGSKYGLGALSGVKVNGVDGLLNSLAGTQPTAEQAVAAFAASAHNPIDHSLVAALQQRMLLAGMYSDAKYRPRYGVVDAEDITAFKNLISVGAQTGADLNSYLTQKAADGQYQGLAAAIQTAQADVRQIKHANPVDLQAVLQNQFQSTLGRKPTAAEMAGFIAAYDHTTTALQQSAYDQADAAKQTSAVDPSTSPALQAALGSQDPDTVPTPGSAAHFRMAEEGVGSSRGMFNVDDLVRSIGGQETGGGAGAYSNTNADSGAHGKYQIMPSSWPGMAQQAGLSPNAPQTPGNQELVARTVLASYAQKYGSLGAAAAAWYGGPRAGEKYAANPNDPYLTRQQGKYPSIAQYVQQVTSRMNRAPANGGPILFSTPPDVGGQAAPVTINTTDAPNPGAAAENYARSSNPGLAGAHDITGQFSNFLGLLSGHFGAGSNL